MENTKKNMVLDMLVALKFDAKVTECRLFSYITGTLFDDGAYKHLMIFFDEKGEIERVLGSYDIGAKVCCLRYLGELYLTDFERVPVLHLDGYGIEDFVSIAATIVNA